jgi:hypothetical protein
MEQESGLNNSWPTLAVPDRHHIAASGEDMGFADEKNFLLSIGQS